MTLEDLGPAPGGGRLIRRSERLGEHRVIETVAYDLDATLLDPDPSAFQPLALFPVDPGTASRVTIGPLTFTRGNDGGDTSDDKSANRWQLNGLANTDQELAAQLMASLAQLAVDPESAQTNNPTASVVSNGLRCDIHQTHRDITRLADIPAWRFSDRRLLPHATPDNITALVITPTGGAPEIYSRSAGDPWPDDIRDDLTALTDALCTATVSDWTGQSDAFGPWDATITVATDDGATVRLRLAADGRVAVLERARCQHQIGPATGAR